MIFKKSPDNLFNAVFNVPQGAVMTVAVSLYMGQADAVSLLRTFVCAYCAGVMLTAFVRIPEFGNKVAALLRCRRKVAGYLVSAGAGGMLMGVLMNFFITFMQIGPVSYFPAAFLHTLLFSVVVSAVSSCLWIAPVSALVGKVYAEKS